jgi:hypothetical protein
MSFGGSAAINAGGHVVLSYPAWVLVSGAAMRRQAWSQRRRGLAMALGEQGAAHDRPVGKRACAAYLASGRGWSELAMRWMPGHVAHCMLPYVRAGECVPWARSLARA